MARETGWTLEQVANLDLLQFRVVQEQLAIDAALENAQREGATPDMLQVIADGDWEEDAN